METLAFYSYKGGVGRSLLVANAARFLAALGRKVVALDLDFEAPGLHYKLAGGPPLAGRRPRRKQRPPAAGGAVAYLLAGAREVAAPVRLDDHCLPVPVPPTAGGWLKLMPAGPAPERGYWVALKELHERLRLDDASGRGLLAVLDLQARIEAELKPDFLLIDARTGVTELGGLATTLLADVVVCLFVANHESLDGTLAVVEALKAAPRPEKRGPLRVVPVLARTAGAGLTDPRGAAGIGRLLEVGEAKPGDGKKKAELFSLPHDEVIAAAERVVGGESRASALSPLYKAYLELFEHLLPAGAKAAREGLQRMEAVAEVKRALTGGRSRFDFDGVLQPWSEAAIDEGVSFDSEIDSLYERRYADLVCRDPSGRPLLIVEYVADGENEGAKEFWEKSTSVRSVVLLVRRGHHVVRDVYARRPPPHEHELREADRWELPLPKEFELLADVGDRSVEAMLDALRRGHVEAAHWLISEWRVCVLAGTFPEPMPGPPFRPLRARRILDGLAATADVATATEVLRLASPRAFDPWHDRPRFGRRHPSDLGDEIDRVTEEHLFAPLFWRLPVEAVREAAIPRHHPGDTLCLGGYRLLAERVMGLFYDPDGAAIAAALAPGSAASISEDDEKSGRRGMHRRRWERFESIELSDEPSPLLLATALKAEHPHWRGTLEEAKLKLGDEAALGRQGSRARRCLRELVEERRLTLQGLLGEIDGDRVDLYLPVIAATAELLGLAPRYLQSVVFIQLSVASLAAEATDLDGEAGFGFARSALAFPPQAESPVHVALIQGFTHRLIQRLGDDNLAAAFEKLSERQPEDVRRWDSLRDVPLERLRTLLLRARASPTALGLGWPERD